MQRSGTEWMFRLAQEPRRLFRRYVTDFWVFGSSILPQWWELQARPGRHRRRVAGLLAAPPSSAAHESWCRMRLPNWLDLAAVRKTEGLFEEMTQGNQDCLLELGSTRFVDSTGIGFLVRLQKRLRSRGRQLILLEPSRPVLRALRIMRLTEFFHIAENDQAAVELLEKLKEEPLLSAGLPQMAANRLLWRGEITAANAEAVWASTYKYITAPAVDGQKIIDLCNVRFIDSTGLGLLVRARKLSLAREENLEFVGLRPAVRNVLRLSRLEEFLLGSRLPIRARAAIQV